MRLPRSTQRSAPQWPRAPQWRAVNGAGGRNASCSPLERLVPPFYSISLEMPNNSPRLIHFARGTAQFAPDNNPDVRFAVRDVEQSGMAYAVRRRYPAVPEEA